MGSEKNQQKVKKKVGKQHAVDDSGATASSRSTSTSTSTSTSAGETGLWYQRTQLLASLVLAGRRFEAERLALLFFQGSHSAP